MLTPDTTDRCSRLYTSTVITGVTSEYALDLDSNTFTSALLNKLPSSTPLWHNSNNTTSDERVWKQGRYITYINGLISDGSSFSRHEIQTGPPKYHFTAKVSLHLIPECSAYIGNYCVLVIDIYFNTYKLLGGRHFCKDPSIFWIKGSDTKLGLHIQISTMAYINGSYQTQTADFLKGGDNKIEAIKLLHMTLASYSYVSNLMDTSDKLCTELATLICQDVVAEWNPKVSDTCIADLNIFLKHELML